jgi:ferredoxin-NADP reductase
MSIGSTLIDVTVANICPEANGIISLEVHAIGDAVLPLFEAGAHIDVELPLSTGVEVRQYSLCGDPRERHRYVIAVGLDINSRGGSRWIHNQLRKGDQLRIGAPRNNFPVNESASHSILVAGGIGITPILAMARRLSFIGKPWTLYYCARSPGRAAFLDELFALGGGEVVPVFDGMPGVSSLNLAQVVAQAPEHAHLYCCGPAALLQAFLQATASRPAESVHVEWFAGPTKSTMVPAAEGEFEVKLARTHRMLRVSADKSILDVLLDAGVDVPHSCREGVCASCETRVLAGECDHRDLVLTQAEAAANDRMMVCVSRSRGPLLTLDL